MKHRKPKQHIRRYKDHITLINPGVRYRKPRRMAVTWSDYKKIISDTDPRNMGLGDLKKRYVVFTEEGPQNMYFIPSKLSDDLLMTDQLIRIPESEVQRLPTPRQDIDALFIKHTPRSKLFLKGLRPEDDYDGKPSHGLSDDMLELNKMSKRRRKQEPEEWYDEF